MLIILLVLSLSALSVKYNVLVTLLDVITLTISHISFQLFMIEIMISITLSNLLEFPFDYVPCSLFIGKGLILG